MYFVVFTTTSQMTLSCGEAGKVLLIGVATMYALASLAAREKRHEVPCKREQGLSLLVIPSLDGVVHRSEGTQFHVSTQSDNNDDEPQH